MDINKFMKKIIRRLGLASLSLEKYYPLIQETLMDDTLSTFSQFFPYTYLMTKDLSNEIGERGEDYTYIYYLSDDFLTKNELDIISVMSVNGVSSFGEWNAPLQTFNVDEMILGAAAANIRSGLNISTKSWTWLPPNRVKLRGYTGEELLKIEVKIPYPNFGSVPQSLSLSMEELAFLDVKMVLYEELKHYDKLETADGTIDLKIDSWADAESQRKELIDIFRNKAFPNSVSKPYTYE